MTYNSNHPAIALVEKDNSYMSDWLTALCEMANAESWCTGIAYQAPSTLTGVSNITALVDWLAGWYYGEANRIMLIYVMPGIYVYIDNCDQAPEYWSDIEDIID